MLLRSLSLTAAAVSVLPTHAFVPVAQSGPSTTALKAAAPNDRSPSRSAAVATAIVGWTLATQVACANNHIVPTPPNELTSSSSITLAAGAYIPEESYSTFDMKMPSYNVREEVVIREKEEDPAMAEKRTELERAKKAKAEEIAQQKAKAAAARVQKQAEKEAAKEQAKADAAAARAAKIDAMRDEKMKAFAKVQEAKRLQDEAQGNKRSVMDNMKRMYGLD